METLLYFYGETNIDHQLRNGLFAHRRIRSVVERVEFNSVSCINLKGQWYAITVVNVHALIGIEGQ